MSKAPWTVKAPRTGKVSARHLKLQLSRAAATLLAVVATTAGVLTLGLPAQAQSGPSGWNIVPAPVANTDDILLGSACADATNCWGVGLTSSDLGGGGTFDPLVESWNGSAWTLGTAPSLAVGQGGGFFSVACPSATRCFAVGATTGPEGGSSTGTLIAQWNGSSWSVVAGPAPAGSGVVGGFLQGITCTSSVRCTAVGYATDDTGAGLFAISEVWNGATWSLVPVASSGQAYDELSSVTCTDSSDCWAVGTAGPVQQNPNFLPIFPGNAPGAQGLVEHWNGSAWSVVPSVVEPGPGGGYLSGVHCTSSTNCWASGSSLDDTGNAAGLLMEHWNGSAWSDTSTLVADASAPGILSSISCTGPSQCWASGALGTFGGNGGVDFRPKAVVESWNGSAWSIDPTPNVTILSFLNSVSCLPAVGCLAVGSSVTSPGENDPAFQSLIEQMTLPAASNQGLLLAGRDGGVFSYGSASFHGSLGGQRLNAPVVGIASISGGGYRMVGSDGGVFAFGGAAFEGSMGGRSLNRPVVGMAATPDGNGYWLVASDGGVFSFGDAAFYGSTGGRPLNAPIVGMAATPDGAGYWLVASDGGVFAFGDAAFEGSAGAEPLNRPVVGMAATPDGAGYWLVASDGGVFTYGDASFHGSVPGQGIVGQAPVAGIAATPDGSGYWLVGSDGALYTYGDATYLGAPDAASLVAPIIGVATT